MFSIIGLFGSNKRRTKAAYYFFMYSFIFSLFSLFLIIFIYSIANTTNLLELISCHRLSYNQQLISWFLMFATFSAKIPMFPFHIWLPEAHVEAPTLGSIILASLLLKIGGYGFFRFLLPLFPEGTYFFLPLVNLMAILSILYASFAALYQLDLKKVIAYSSIAHMNLGILGIFSLTSVGMQGGIFTMVSHGLVSSALFF